MNVFWFLVGLFLGFDATLAYAWLAERRANRNIVNRIRPYIGTLTFDTPTSRQALARVVATELQKRRRRNSTERRGQPW